ncbi:unnamed protein product [Prunus armeniaca]
MMLLKFPIHSGVGQVRGNQLMARICYVSSTAEPTTWTSGQRPLETLAVTRPSMPNGKGGTESPDDPRDDNVTPQAQPTEELETISISDTQDQANSEVFTWFYNDMPGISLDVISHKLSISPSFKPVRHKRRSYDAERYEAMKTEVDKLQAIGFIHEGTYPIWLANSVLVKKSSGAWRMYQDYTNLNKACLKDRFPLPRIDQLVDATAGHELLSFMDAYSGYNQIFMHPTHREHTTFITDRGFYCYNVMPFGLKNVGATYQ